ncbi:ABC transporter permease [Priestia abyssalis]|uniref:ABC transporter permease n=1 Tax=Priestia abyssalis TaxID=1221450 RepID=UPI0009957177|nr:ABC transporter permease [Priestia abyssalis]
MFLAVRELKHAKLRYMLIGFIMILVAWLTFIVSGLANGLAADNASAIENMKGDYVVLQDNAEQKLARSSIPNEKLDEVRRHEGVKEAFPLSQTMMTLSQTGKDKKIDVTIFGVESKSMIMPDVSEGKLIEKLGENEVIADASLKGDGVVIGDTLENKDTGASMTIVGFAEGQMFSHMPVLYTDIESWNQMVQSTGRQQKPSYSAIIVSGNEDVSISLEKKLSHIEVLTKEEVIKNIPGYKEEQGSLTMMISFLIVIAAFVQAVFFYVITLQKTNQFGVLKAIGAKTSYLAKNLIGQVLILAAAAIGVSIALTFSVSALFPEGMPFELGTDTLVKYSALLIGVAVIGALLSLQRIAKIDAIEAIGRVE